MQGIFSFGMSANRLQPVIKRPAPKTHFGSSQKAKEVEALLKQLAERDKQEGFTKSGSTTPNTKIDNIEFKPTIPAKKEKKESKYKSSFEGRH